MQVGEWFCLDNRYNFNIDPSVDRSLYFGRAELQDRLLKSVKKLFSLSYPVKLVLYGEFGVGKTHTLRHLEYFLDQNQAQYPSVAYYLECGDIEKKTRYIALHQNILDRIGREKVQDLLTKYQAIHGNVWRENIRSEVGSTDLTNAFASLLGYGQNVNTAWLWLQGESLSSGDKTSLGVSLDLDETVHLITALKFIGKLFIEVERRRLTLLIDEMERLGAVDDPDAVHNWTHAFRLLADKSNDTVGIIVAVAFRTVEEMPEPLQNAQVTRRFQEGAGYIEIASFQQKTDIQTFMQDLLGRLVDKKKLADLVKSESLDKVAGFDEKTYPFTKDALGYFIDYLMQASQNQPTPSLVIEKLDDVAFEAMDKGKRLIDKKFLQDQGIV